MARLLFRKARTPSSVISSHQRHEASAVQAITAHMTVDQRLDYLQSEVVLLHRRNFEKDRGKEFESSWTRVLFLMGITFATIVLYMQFVLKTDHPFLDALVPTVGFNISTWSLPFVKEWWIQARHYYQNGETEATTLRREVALLRAESSVSRASARHLAMDVEQQQGPEMGVDTHSVSEDEEEPLQFLTPKESATTSKTTESNTTTTTNENSQKELRFSASTEGKDASAEHVQSDEVEQV